MLFSAISVSENRSTIPGQARIISNYNALGVRCGAIDFSFCAVLAISIRSASLINGAANGSLRRCCGERLARYSVSALGATGAAYVANLLLAVIFVPCL